MYTIIESIETANPPFNGSQEYAASYMMQVTSLPENIRKRIPQIYKRSAIEHRYSCVEDYTKTAENFEFYPPDWSLKPSPSTRARNQLYRESALPVAEAAARKAIESSGIGASEITHIIVVTCTGFYSPGLDIELVKGLGLGNSTQRTIVGFMGCYAAFNGMRIAHAFCTQNSNARVLLVCVELCTLHFQVDESMGNAVVNALFSDGAAAMVITSRDAQESSGKIAYIDSHCILDDNSMEDMTWDIGDSGFLMGLSPRVPGIIAGHIPDFLKTLLDRHKLSLSDIDFWAIHPGGKAIVDKTKEVLSLTEEQVFDSLEVLRNYGNMSSPTILFILKRFLDRHRDLQVNGQEGFSNGIAMAFGPGLTVESALFQKI